MKKLNKETIAALDNKTMSEVKGGFTYSLSLGSKCQYSFWVGAKTAKDCEASLEEMKEQ